MTVTGGSALGKDEIDQMVREAEARADEDKQRRESVELRNEADALAFRTEKLLEEHDAILTDEVKQPVKEAVEKLKQALQGSDNDAEVKTAMEELNKTAATMGQAVYAAAQARQQEEAQAQAQAESDQPAADGDDVVEAEIVEEDK